MPSDSLDELVEALSSAVRHGESLASALADAVATIASYAPGS